ncbi:MAG TPA: tripartite tricarboxylate transporter substrate binding protein [Burkholderiales bacterium]|nr:tripartite tricarboxylate transporter substrate binding protein [Burkholderiales bacterium]
MLNRRSFLATAAGLAVAPGVLRAQAGAYPNRPVRIVVPLPPGGSPDYMARLLSERLPPVLGQPFVVENKPGAGGTIGREVVARSAPDGYTLVMSESAHVLSASLGAKLPYDPIRDFEPIALTGTIPFVLGVNASFPAQTLNEFIAVAKAEPGKLTYGSAGVGAPHQFAAELLATMSGIQVVHVPYKGSAGIVPALLANEINFTIGAVNSLLPHFRSGKLRALAVAGTKRSAVLPDVPTIAEAGPLPGYAVDIWLGVLAPAGTPRPIIERLNVEVNRVIGDPQIVRERLLPVGIEPVAPVSPEQFLEVMKSDLEKYTKVAQNAKMKAE